MRRWSQSAALLAVAISGIGAAQADPGSFFKDMFGGGKGGESDAPAFSGPRLQDPDEAYCPQIEVRDGGAAIQAFAGAAGDSSRLRHQLTFGRMSRECLVRPGGAVGVRVGVQVRALLGPAGAAGTFEAPLTVAVTYNEKVVASRTRRVSVTVPAGAAQGGASVVEDELLVPADKAVGYAIEVAIGGAPARAKAPARSAGRHAKPQAPSEAAVSDESAVPGQ